MSLIRFEESLFEVVEAELMAGEASDAGADMAAEFALASPGLGAIRDSLLEPSLPSSLESDEADVGQDVVAVVELLDVVDQVWSMYSKLDEELVRTSPVRLGLD